MWYFFYLLLFIFLLSFRIHREPAFQHAFALFEDLLDGLKEENEKTPNRGDSRI